MYLKFIVPSYPMDELEKKVQKVADVWALEAEKTEEGYKMELIEHYLPVNNDGHVRVTLKEAGFAVYDGTGYMLIDEVLKNPIGAVKRMKKLVGY